MSYIEKSLGEGERVVHIAKFHWWYSFQAWAALVLFGWLGIGIIIFLVMMVHKWTTEIGITTHRLILRQGLFTLRTKELALPNIEGAQVTQSFMGRILNYGRLRIEGTGDDAIELPTIDDPIGFRRAIETAKGAKDGARRV